jgi:hypothetical protein
MAIPGSRYPTPWCYLGLMSWQVHIRYHFSVMTARVIDLPATTPENAIIEGRVWAKSVKSPALIYVLPRGGDQPLASWHRDEDGVLRDGQGQPVPG